MSAKQLVTSRYLWIVVIAVGAVQFFQKSFGASTVLPLAIILIMPNYDDVHDGKAQT